MRPRLATESQKPKIGFACAYTPLALIDAAGYQPYRILPMGDCLDRAGQLLHENLCPHVKKILDRALADDIPELDGIIFINSCNAMRRLYDAWLVARPNDRAILIDLPTTKDEMTIRFFANELSQLVKTLSTWSGKSITTESIRHSLHRYNELARALLDIRKKISSGLIKGGGDRLQSLYNHAATEPLEKTLDLIKQISEEPLRPSPNGHVPIYLFGNVLPEPQVFSLLESCGAAIVGEDLCTGNRLFSIIEESATDDILFDLARGLLNRNACARTFETNHPGTMANSILNEAKACGARGIIGHTVKFCDPYVFRMPAASETFRKEGMPFLMLEGDCTLRSIGQHKTRIEAFVEMMR